MTRFVHLHALLTGEPTPEEKLLEAWCDAKEAIARARTGHAEVIPLRRYLKTLTHIRLVEGV